jgi:hypothetical protein
LLLLSANLSASNYPGAAYSATVLVEQSHNKASGGPVVDDGAQDGDLDAVLLPDRPRKVDHACVCHTSGVRLRVP